MADISIEFVGRQLQNIQAELREMKFAAEVERRNQHSAFNNLVAEVGVKLGTFEAVIEHRLGAMDERLGAMDERLGAMDERLGAMNERLGAMNERLNVTDGRVESVQQGLATVQQQLDLGLGTVQRQLDRIEQLLTSRGAPS